MHGRILGWPILLLVGTVLCAGSTVAWAQPDSAYGWANDSSYAPAETTGAYHADAGLADRLADVEAELAKIKKKDDAAKKKAAGRPSVKVGGRIQWDIASFNQDANSILQIGDQLDGTEFRRARIFLAGDAFHVLDYKIQMDFADTNRTDGGAMLQSTAFKDAYITVKELPLLGHIRLGHFKEPFGLEQLTSARFITFMERSLADENAFVPARNCGIMAFDTYWDQRGTWAIGAFVSKMTSEPPVYRSDDGGMAVTMRGTYLPWYDEATDGRGLLHLGVGYSYRDMDDDIVRFRQRPESHLAGYFVNTGNIVNAPYWQLVNLEAALVYGPLSVQTEFFGAYVHRDGAPDVRFNGCYAYVSYFLTGEHRPYKRSTGAFDRVKPHENFFRVRAQDGCVYTGKGAWEFAYRYSYIDLEDEGILGGRAYDHTLGLNWYLNPYTRVMFNYVNSTLNTDFDGSLDVFEMRAQIDF